MSVKFDSHRYIKLKYLSLFFLIIVIQRSSSTEYNQTKGESTSRTPRGVFQKLQAGAAFLTGFRLGTILAENGIEYGQGSLATAHTFHLFGRPVSTALSVAYGEQNLRPGSFNKPGSGLPPGLQLQDEYFNTTDSNSTSGHDNVIHIAVVQNPSPDTWNKLRDIAKVKTDEDFDPVYERRNSSRINSKF